MLELSHHLPFWNTETQMADVPLRNLSLSFSNFVNWMSRPRVPEVGSGTAFDPGRVKKAIFYFGAIQKFGVLWNVFAEVKNREDRKFENARKFENINKEMPKCSIYNPPPPPPPQQEHKENKLSNRILQMSSKDKTVRFWRFRFSNSSVN